MVYLSGKCEKEFIFNSNCIFKKNFGKKTIDLKRKASAKLLCKERTIPRANHYFEQKSAFELPLKTFAHLIVIPHKNLQNREFLGLSYIMYKGVVKEAKWVSSTYICICVMYT